MCGLPVAILEFVVYRDPTGCLKAFYFNPFEVRDDSNPSGDGLSHLNRIKLGGAATIDATLSASLVVTRGGKEHCFVGDKIARAVSQLNSKNEFNFDPSIRVLTTEDLRALLYQRRDCYHRVCV